MKQKQRYSASLLISWIIAVAYLVYIIDHFTNQVGGSTGAEQIGAGIATALVMPHIVCVGLALIFNIIGWAGIVRWAALVGGIMYSVAAVVFPLYALFVVPSIVLSFVGFVRLKKLNDPTLF